MDNSVDDEEAMEILDQQLNVENVTMKKDGNKVVFFVDNIELDVSSILKKKSMNPCENAVHLEAVPLVGRDIIQDLKNKMDNEMSSKLAEEDEDDNKEEEEKEESGYSSPSFRPTPVMFRSTSIPQLMVDSWIHRCLAMLARGRKSEERTESVTVKQSEASPDVQEIKKSFKFSFSSPELKSRRMSSSKEVKIIDLEDELEEEETQSSDSVTLSCPSMGSVPMSTILTGADTPTGSETLQI